MKARAMSRNSEQTVSEASESRRNTLACGRGTWHMQNWRGGRPVSEHRWVVLFMRPPLAAKGEKKGAPLAGGSGPPLTRVRARQRADHHRRPAGEQRASADQRAATTADPLPRSNLHTRGPVEAAAAFLHADPKVGSPSRLAHVRTEQGRSGSDGSPPVARGHR